VPAEPNLAGGHNKVFK